MIWKTKKSNDIKNKSLPRKRRYVNKLFRNWEKLFEHDLRNFQEVRGLNDWNPRKLEEGGEYYDQKFEIIDFTDGGEYDYTEHIGFVIDNPNFNCWVMIYKGGVFSTDDMNHSDFNDRLLPDFVKNWAYDWIIDNETLLDSQLKDKKLERIKEKWGENFIKELNIDEATLLKAGKL